MARSKAKKEEIEVLDNNLDNRDKEILNEISRPKSKSFKIEENTKKFEENVQYFCYTKFGSIKAYGKQLNIARPEYMSQFIKFEVIK